MKNLFIIVLLIIVPGLVAFLLAGFVSGTFNYVMMPQDVKIGATWFFGGVSFFAFFVLAIALIGDKSPKDDKR